jgi:HEAT repeat protein
MDQEEFGLLRALAGRIEDDDVDAGTREAAPETEPSLVTRAPGDDELTVIRRPDPDSMERARRDLRSAETHERLSAVRSLLDSPPSAQTAAIAVAALQDPDVAVRRMTLDVLARAPELAPIDALLAATLDSEDAIRARAFGIMGQSGNLALVSPIAVRIRLESGEGVAAAALGALSRLLRSSDPQGPELDDVTRAMATLVPRVQFRFRHEVRQIAASFSEWELMSRLNSSELEIRLGAAVLALEHGSEEAAAALRRMAGDDPDPVVRRLAQTPSDAPERERVTQTKTDPSPRSPEEGRPGPGRVPLPEGGAYGEQIALPALVAALDDPHADVRTQAAKALEGVDPERIAAWLRGLLRVGSPAEVVEVARRVARLEASQVFPDLAEAILKMPEGHERSLAVTAAQSARGFEQQVASWRADPDPDHRISALRLGRLLRPNDTGPAREAMRDPSAEVRLMAVESLGGAAQTPTAQSLLRAMVGDSSAPVRRAAVQALRDAPVEIRVAAAEAAAEGPDRDVRVEAVSLLGGGTAPETTALIRILHGAPVEVARAAVDLLGRRPTLETLALLWNALRSLGTQTGEVILDGLQPFAGDTLRHLAEQALESPDPRERAIGLAVQARLEEPGVIRRLIDSLMDSASEVRIEALSLLGRKPTSSALDGVGGRLRDPDPTVRLLAVEVLRATQDDRALPHLLEAARDPVEEVSGAAREAILARRSSSVAEVLAGALATPSHRRAASQLLVAMPNEAITALLQVLPDADQDLRRTIGEILSEVEAEVRLAPRLEDRRLDRRKEAVEALSVVDGARAVPPLIQRLDDPDPSIRLRVAQILGEIRDPRALDPLKRSFMSDPDMSVVAAVEGALRNIIALQGDEGGEGNEPDQGFAETEGVTR